MLRKAGISDYELDLEFAWTKEQRETKKGSERPQVFENIRKSANRPSGGKNGKDITEIVKAIDTDPRFKGSKALYEAELWDLFKSEFLDAEHLSERFDRYLAKFNLVQVNPSIVPPFVKLQMELGKVKFFERCLALSTSGIHAVHGIAILWMLYVQTWQASNWEIRQSLEYWLDHHLDRFFQTYLTDQKPLKFYVLAIHAMKNTRLAEERTECLQSIGQRSEWAILPNWDWDKLNEEEWQKLSEYLRSDRQRIFC